MVCRLAVILHPFVLSMVCRLAVILHPVFRLVCRLAVIIQLFVLSLVCRLAVIIQLFVLSVVCRLAVIAHVFLVVVHNVSFDIMTPLLLIPDIFASFRRFAKCCDIRIFFHVIIWICVAFVI